MPAAATTALVVEDDRSLRTLMRRALERLDQRVLTASDGESALAVFDHYDGPIDLVVADVGLPRMNGVKLAETLRSRDPGIAILLVSGCFDGPPGEFPELDKPYSLASLEQRIGEVITAARGGAPARIRVET